MLGALQKAHAANRVGFSKAHLPHVGKVSQLGGISHLRAAYNTRNGFTTISSRVRALLQRFRYLTLRMRQCHIERIGRFVRDMQFSADDPRIHIHDEVKTQDLFVESEQSPPSILHFVSVFLVDQQRVVATHARGAADVTALRRPYRSPSRPA